jgi:hypothetical protein
VSRLPLRRLGVATHTSDRSDARTAAAASSVTETRPSPIIRPSRSSSPGSLTGERPLRERQLVRVDVHAGDVCPAAARQAADTEPTYPRPNIASYRFCHVSAGGPIAWRLPLWSPYVPSESWHGHSSRSARRPGSPGALMNNNRK